MAHKIKTYEIKIVEVSLSNGTDYGVTFKQIINKETKTERKYMEAFFIKTEQDCLDVVANFILTAEVEK